MNHLYTDMLPDDSVQMMMMMTTQHTHTHTHILFMPETYHRFANDLTRTIINDVSNLKT